MIEMVYHDELFSCILFSLVSSNNLTVAATKMSIPTCIYNMFSSFEYLISVVLSISVSMTY